MSKIENNVITQIDYIRILIEENRWGEASDLIDELKYEVSLKINKIKADTENMMLNLPKSLIKSKPDNWVVINDNWYKMKKISKNELILEISKNILIKKEYTIKKQIN